MGEGDPYLRNIKCRVLARRDELNLAQSNGILIFHFQIENEAIRLMGEEKERV